MDRKTFRFSYSDIDLKVSDVGKILDYERGSDRELVEMIIEEVLSEARDMCDIRAEYALYDVEGIDTQKDSITVNGISFNVGKIVRTQMKRATRVAVFLCTAGQAIGEHARQLIREKDFLKGYILDIAGSEIVEGAADLMQANLKESISGNGMLITNRYSPGYCGWHVSEQHKLFRLLPDNSCNITLLPSSLMDPVKSVSGFIGAGENVRFNNYTCNACDMNDCIYRRLKSNN